jgi:hypothetical protein
MIKVTEFCEVTKAAAWLPELRYVPGLPPLEGIVVVVSAQLAGMGDMILSSYNFWVRLAVQFTCICMVLIKRTRNEGFDAELPGTISTSE